MRCFAYCVSLAAVVISSTMAAARSGEPPESKRLLQQVRHAASAFEDPYERASILHDVALVEAKAGDAKAAAATLKEAAQVAASLTDGGARDQRFALIAPEQANLGHTTEALQTIQAIGRETTRLHALSEMATALADAGKTERASEIAAMIEDSFWRDGILGDIAVAQAKQGDVETALKTVGRIEAGSGRNTTRLLIVLARAEAGDFPQALAIAGAMEDPTIKARALSEIASAQRKSGDQAAAAATDKRVLEIAGSIEEETPYGIIALTHARLGHVSAALEAARRVDEGWYRLNILRQIAVIQAERGDFDAAMKTALLIGDPSERDHAVQQIGGARAESRDIPGALEIAKTIEDDYYGSAALRQIGLVQLAGGDRAGCRKTLRQALQRLDGVEIGGGVKVLILQETGAALLQAGDPATAARAFQQACEAAANYEDDAYRAGLLQGIARCQAAGGQASDALAWGAESPVPLVKARVLLGVAEGLLDRTNSQRR